MSGAIAALDQALRVGRSEWIWLRRTVGVAPNDTSVQVKCLAAVTAVSTEQIQAGIPATELNVVISPTQINEAQWPGGTFPAAAPFDVDQRIPRAGVTDKILMRGQPPRTITHSDPQFVCGELVRINLRVTG